MNEKTDAKYLELCEIVETIELAFLCSYMIESEFSHVHYLLNREALGTQNMLFKLTNLPANFVIPPPNPPFPLKNISRIKVLFHL